MGPCPGYCGGALISEAGDCVGMKSCMSSLPVLSELLRFHHDLP